MQISVFGIGYVGAVSAACLANDGHNVIAVDPNPQKVGPLNEGISPIVEPGLEEMIKGGISSKRLVATSDVREAVQGTDLSFVCVGTPSRSNGSLDTAYVSAAAEQIGAAIREKNDFHSVVMRSTILPGTMESIVLPALERASGRQAGVGFGVAYYPEFLRESTAIADYYDPGAIIFGRHDQATVDRLVDLHKIFKVEPKIVSIRTAEAVKYTNNAWHALKISFANEIGNICKEAGIDGHTVMEVLCADTRLNISKAYLKPGFAFGGSCLPKDLRALRFAARKLDVPTPILDATMEANEEQLRRAYSMVAATGKRRIGIIGLSFKPETDDLRESPLVELAERLYGRGYDIRIYDPNIQVAKLTGANLQFVKAHLPHLTSLLTADIDEVIDHAEAFVLGNRDEAKRLMAALSDDRPLIDLVRIDQTRCSGDLYQGICW
ncbi:UDP-glucose/GDP-mannose dehydrogenase family protein [Microvirga sp. CF3016]|uniref:UDP-glucose/GDP-mannose dehydrogenase family protein n=1 Tax=Microvirga sp. CF3016 TaxID=3110181 RepID=UPI002E774121|nr:UDP-glucose/GDP-mannose dehydrogenase family protein [Microvirga sp. CF3016]MEE1611667.1 UDP-glucose/GDP-mannose dehydrogenase family protein [Microvirga sp. CF3016]